MSYDEHLISMAGGDGDDGIFAGHDLDGEGPVTILHDTARGEVIIKVGHSVVAATEALSFFTAIRKLP